MPKKTMNLTHEDAQFLIDNAMSGAREAGIAITVAVAEAGGHTIGLLRMDGTKLASIDVSQGKAWTSAIFQRPSGDYSAPTAPGGGAYGMLNTFPGKFVPVLGGHPVMIDGECIGAIGVSGGSGEQDASIAKAAAAALASR